MFTIGDFAEFAGIPVEDVDERWLYWRMARAEALIRSYNDRLPDDVNEWPQSAVIVALQAITRSLEAEGLDVPGNITSENLQAGPLGRTYQFDPNSTSTDLYLKAPEIRIIRGRRGGAFAIDTLPADREYRPAAFRHCDEWVW